MVSGANVIMDTGMIGGYGIGIHAGSKRVIMDCSDDWKGDWGNSYLELYEFVWA